MLSLQLRVERCLLAQVRRGRRAAAGCSGQGNHVHGLSHTAQGNPEHSGGRVQQNLRNDQPRCVTPAAGQGSSGRPNDNATRTTHFDPNTTKPNNPRSLRAHKRFVSYQSDCPHKKPTCARRTAVLCTHHTGRHTLNRVVRTNTPACVLPCYCTVAILQKSMSTRHKMPPPHRLALHTRQDKRHDTGKTAARSHVCDQARWGFTTRPGAGSTPAHFQLYNTGGKGTRGQPVGL